MNPQQPSKTSPVVPFLLSLAAFATGCGAGSEAPSAVASEARALEALPATCQDIRTAQPSAPDGPYLLYVGGKAALAWTAWCHDMAGTPKEYLTLEQTGSGSNDSQYLAGVNSPGTTVRTSYTRLRINPVTLRVNTADLTFSTSTGALSHGGVAVTPMPYAAAMGGSTWGVGNVDLRGTPFAVASGQFSVGGVSTGGSSFNDSQANQVVALSAYGGRGWVAPVGRFNPFNQSGQPLLLVYAAPQ